MHIPKLLLCALLAAAFLALPMQAQDSLEVDQAELAKHVDHHVPPIYPPIAKAARIQGEVVFQVNVSKAGHVESLKILSGPAMLQQAAMDCLRQWTYRPFLKDGAPVPATGKASIFFSLGDSPEALRKDQEIADRYFKLDDQCHKALAKHDNSPETAAICRKAADTADEFAPDSRFIEKRSAFISATLAFGNSADFTTAMIYAEKAVSVVQLGHDDNSGMSAAYEVRGISEGNLRRLPEAERDLNLAEDYGRKALNWANHEAPGLSREYTNDLALCLKLHAAVLLALDRSEEAAKKLNEMESLSK